MSYDYERIEALHARARRERAQAVYRLLIRPVLAFLTTRPEPRRRLRQTRMLNRSAFG